MEPYLILLAGIAVAAVGGELFVRGAVGLATGLRVPPGVIGATVAAFATSTPELSVALNAAFSGQPELPLGDALGSNVTNVGLVLGLALLMLPMAVNRGDIRRDLPFAFFAPAATALLILDREVSRFDGALLVVVFGIWLWMTIRHARRARSAAQDVLGEASVRRAIWVSAGGLACLVVAGRLIVISAKGIGDDLGLDPFIVGATLVAFGTSAPELATTLIATLRGHAEVGIGTLIGSNIFNNLWIVGVTAMVEPIPVRLSEVMIALVASAVVLLFVIPGASGRLGRGRGAALVVCYGSYVGVLVASG
ncbi:MAG: sodium:calcium antiporter [Dehalococcoidia bacterium]